MAKYIPTSEVRRLVRGSYEDLSHQVQMEVEGDRENIFGEGLPVRIVGTFRGHVIALNGSGKLSKVFYEVADSGDVVLVGKEMLDVPIISSDRDRAKFLQSEAREVAGMFFDSGEYPQVRRIADIMRSVDSSAFADKQVAQVRMDSSTRDRPWRRFLAEHLEQADVGVLGGFRAKYGYLEDAGDPEAHRKLVEADLLGLVESYGDLESTLGDSFARLTKLGETQPDLLKNESAASILGTFRDFMEHLGESKKAISDSISEIKTIFALGELYDTMSLELTRRTLAGRYIQQVVEHFLTTQTL